MSLEDEVLQTEVVRATYAAVEAGRVILDCYYNCDVVVSTKPDSSPVTQADLRANDVISQCLQSSHSLGLAIVSEETEPATYAERKNWECYWLVDPLDGTKEFIKKTGEFTVNIALMKSSIPWAGVIYIPIEETLYFSYAGVGSFRIHLNEYRELFSERMTFASLVAQSEKLPLVKVDSSEYVVVMSRSRGSRPQFEDYIKVLRGTYPHLVVKSLGSSLKFCRVAEGAADRYVRFGPTMEWDTAAGQALVGEIGYKVVSYDDGKELAYNKQDMKNPWFIVSNEIV